MFSGSSRRSEEISLDRSFMSVASEMLSNRKISDLYIPAFGMSVKVEVESVTPTGIDSGVIMGRIKGQPFSLVTITFQGNDFERVEIYPEGTPSVFMQSTSRNSLAVFEADPEVSARQVCGHEQEEVAR